MVVGIVALPLAIAFAVASGVSPQKGLITAIIAGFLISALGGSRVQIGGPTGAFVVIVYGIVERYGIDGLIVSTMMAGVLLVVFGVLRLGALLKYFPQSLIVGFTSGIALVIFSTQVKDALGLSISQVPSDFIGKWQVYFEHIATINPYALGLTIFTILITITAGRFTGRVPGSFIALILGTLIVLFGKLPVETLRSVYGAMPRGFSVGLPTIHLSDLPAYIQPAVNIALLGAIESLLSAVVADGMISGHHRSNTELIAQGIANIVTPLFGGIPATGAIARTAVNIKNGGRTPIAGIVHSVTLLLIMLFFGRYAELIPVPVLAGILIVVAYNMSEWRTFIGVLRGSSFDILVLLSTFFLTVLVDLTVAIQVGVVLSALLFMRRMAIIPSGLPAEVDKDIIEDYSDLPRDVSVYEISGPLFFASAREYAETIKVAGIRKRVLIIRMRHVPFIDATGLHNLESAVTMLRHSGVDVIFSGVREQVISELTRFGIGPQEGGLMFFDTFSGALEYALTYNGQE